MEDGLASWDVSEASSCFASREDTMTSRPKQPVLTPVATAILAVCAVIMAAPATRHGTACGGPIDSQRGGEIGFGPPCDPIHISARTNARLVSLLTAKALDSLKASGVHPDCVFTVMDSLTARRAVEILVATIDDPVDHSQEEYAILAAYDLDDPRVVAAMARHVSAERTVAAYYAANSLAKRGDRQALAVLRSNAGRYDISSAQWATTVRLFGRYRFMPAVLYLIQSLDAGSLNLADAARESLLDIFPGPYPLEQGPASWQRHFRERYREHLASAGQNESS